MLAKSPKGVTFSYFFPSYRIKKGPAYGCRILGHPYNSAHKMEDVTFLAYFDILSCLHTTPSHPLIILIFQPAYRDRSHLHTELRLEKEMIGLVGFLDLESRD